MKAIITVTVDDVTIEDVPGVDKEVVQRAAVDAIIEDITNMQSSFVWAVVGDGEVFVGMGAQSATGKIEE